MSEKLHVIDSVLGDRIIEKAIIYAGEFEDNTRLPNVLNKLKRHCLRWGMN